MRSPLFLALFAGLLVIVSAWQSVLADDVEQAAAEDARVEDVATDQRPAEDRNDDDDDAQPKEEDAQQPPEPDAMSADDDDDDHRPGEAAESMAANEDDDDKAEHSSDRSDDSPGMAAENENAEHEESNDAQSLLEAHRTLFDTTGMTVRNVVEELAKQLKFDVVYSLEVRESMLDRPARTLTIAYQPVPASFILSRVLQDAGLNYESGETGSMIIISSTGDTPHEFASGQVGFYNCNGILRALNAFGSENAPEMGQAVNYDENWDQLIDLLHTRLNNLQLTEVNERTLTKLGPLLVVNGSESVHQSIGVLLKQIEEALGLQPHSESSASQANRKSTSLKGD